MKREDQARAEGKTPAANSDIQKAQEKTASETPLEKKPSLAAAAAAAAVVAEAAAEAEAETETEAPQRSRRSACWNRRYSADRACRRR